MAAMASTIGTARGKTQGSCRPLAFMVVSIPLTFTVCCSINKVNINGIDTTMKAKGRHDPCVLPRAVPIVEAMAAMTILDYYLIDRTTQL